MQFLSLVVCIHIVSFLWSLFCFANSPYSGLSCQSVKFSALRLALKTSVVPPAFLCYFGHTFSVIFLPVQCSLTPNLNLFLPPPLGHKNEPTWHNPLDRILRSSLKPRNSYFLHWTISLQTLSVKQHRLIALMRFPPFCFAYAISLTCRGYPLLIFCFIWS